LLQSLTLLRNDRYFVIASAAKRPPCWQIGGLLQSLAFLRNDRWFVIASTAKRPPCWQIGGLLQSLTLLRNDRYFVIASTAKRSPCWQIGGLLQSLTLLRNDRWYVIASTAKQFIWRPESNLKPAGYSSYPLNNSYCKQVPFHIKIRPPGAAEGLSFVVRERRLLTHQRRARIPLRRHRSFFHHR